MFGITKIRKLIIEINIRRTVIKEIKPNKIQKTKVIQVNIYQVNFGLSDWTEIREIKPTKYKNQSNSKIQPNRTI